MLCGKSFTRKKDKIMNFRTERKPKKPGKRMWGLQIAVTVAITLVFVILIAFFAGRTIASKGNEDLRLEFYLLLKESPFSGCIKYIFDEESIPDTTPVLPPCVNSSADGISPSDSVSGENVLQLSHNETSFSAHVLAINDPAALCMGKSTFDHNYISEIKHLENASYAFSAADNMQLNVIASNGSYAEDADGTFFGMTDNGILAFGGIKQFRDTNAKLMWAQEASIYTLIHSSLPTSFSPSEHAITAPTLSIGQCADGSLLIIIADARASVNDLTKLFYKYSAVNAAIVYVGESAGIICPDGSVLSFGKDFEDAQYSHAWLIK